MHDMFKFNFKNTSTNILYEIIFGIIKPFLAPIKSLQTMDTQFVSMEKYTQKKKGFWVVKS
jgi:hypothetical protein